MARARSPSSIEAEKLYCAGMKLVDIAKKIGIPDSTVRRWKSTQKWDGHKSEQDKKKESERSDKKKANARKSKGAPKGNKNAVGHAPSTPKRNKNAQKHGAYSSVYWDTLDDDEKLLLTDVPSSEESLLKQQIELYTIRERRLMHKITEFKEDLSKGLYIKSVRKDKQFTYDGEGKTIPEKEETHTETENWVKGLATLESELTKVQRAKTKCIDSLIRLRSVNERYDDLLNGWRSKAIAERGMDEEEEIESVVIYLPDNGRN